MFSRNKKGKVSKKDTTTYTASTMDLVLGIDFELVPEQNNESVCVKLLKGKYAGVKYKYNSIGVKEDPEKTGSENLMMTMDYKVLDFNNLSKSIEKEEDFNNTVFNVVYALMMIQNSPNDSPEKDDE